jgi:hypothetical protein
MESITYEIAPGGDIELVLNNPNKQNIVPRLSTDTLDEDPRYPEFVNPLCRGRYAVFEKLYEETPPNCKVLIRVSSCHLKFASRMF